MRLAVAYLLVCSVGAKLIEDERIQQVHVTGHLLHAPQLALLLGVGEFNNETRRGSLQTDRHAHTHTALYISHACTHNRNRFVQRRLESKQGNIRMHALFTCNKLPLDPTHESTHTYTHTRVQDAQLEPNVICDSSVTTLNYTQPNDPSSVCWVLSIYIFIGSIICTHARKIAASAPTRHTRALNGDHLRRRS